MKKNKALFAISNLWLWHATRTLAVIDMYLLKNYEIDIICYWNTLNFLKEELKWKKIKYIKMVDYPHLERWFWVFYYVYLFFDVFKTLRLINKEKKYIKNIENNYDFIFSDWRYWVYSRNTPSFLLSHQLSFVMPKLYHNAQIFVDYYNKKHFKNFKVVFIPDYKKENKSLSWKLSHPKWVDSINHKYIWILSSFYDTKLIKKNLQEIDYYFVISWYLLGNKQSFIDTLISEAKKLEWKKVFVLGDTNNYYIKELENDITIYSCISGEQRKQFFENAKLVISRSWYTTIMDCAELDKKAILFPTTNQTEQEYLADFLNEKKYFVIWNNDSDLIELVWKTKSINKFEASGKTKNALKKIEKTISEFCE